MIYHENFATAEKVKNAALDIDYYSLNTRGFTK